MQSVLFETVLIQQSLSLLWLSDLFFDEDINVLDSHKFKFCPAQFFESISRGWYEERFLVSPLFVESVVSKCKCSKFVTVLYVL